MSPFQWRKKRRAHESSDIVYDEMVSDLKSPEPIARRFSAHFVWDIQQRTKFEHLKVRTRHLKPQTILSIYGEKSHSVAIFAVVIIRKYFEFSHYIHTQSR